MSYKTRRRSPDGKFLSNKSSLSGIFTKQGKGKKIFNGKNVTDFLRKILGNRVFDLYLKYLGITSLTTSTLVPFGLVLSAEYAKKIITKKKIGKFSKNRLPILDNSLVGNYLKIAGLSLLELTPATLLPLGVIMIIYDLAMRNLVKQKGGRLTVGSSIPPNFVQKVDALISGQNGSPLFEAYDLLTPKLQQACSETSCAPNNISTSHDFRIKAMDVKGFKTNKIPQENSVNEIKVVRNADVNIGDYKGKDYVAPLMAGGSAAAATNNYSTEIKQRDYVPLYADIKGGVETGLGGDVHVAYGTQFGGKNIYTKIVNPKTGRKVNIAGPTGRSIIKQYLNFVRGGGAPIDSENFSLSRHEANNALTLCNKRLKQLAKKQRGGLPRPPGALNTRIRAATAATYAIPSASPPTRAASATLASERKYGKWGDENYIKKMLTEGDLGLCDQTNSVHVAATIADVKRLANKAMGLRLGWFDTVDTILLEMQHNLNS